MRGREVQEFETKLRRLFDEIDAELEDRWGGNYPLHPARPRQGRSSNPETDGLFNVGASFSTGYGSEYGRGYVIETRMVTLTTVDGDTRERIRSYVARRVTELLSQYFPDRDLDVVRDGDLYKVTGDLSL
ncbi:MAG: hypothetical protein WD492_05695 [Alkalispirochaeta sp.]